MNLEKLTKKIQELVPELMELSFGCEVLYSTVNKPDGDVLTILDSVTEEHYFIETYSDWFGYYKVERIGIIEILGHPIQLHHVLQAIDKVELSPYTFVGVMKNGLKLTTDESNVEVQWNLALALSEQNEDVINFLTEILCP